MSNEQLDKQELLSDVYNGLGVVLGLKGGQSQPLPKLLSRHWTVFQVPSASTPNYIYYVVGSLKDGWRCSCVGFQSSGRCYHADTVARVWRQSVDQNRHRGAKKGWETRLAKTQAAAATATIGRGRAGRSAERSVARRTRRPTPTPQRTR